MNTIIKIAIIFLAITGASTLLYNYTDVTFGTIDFFIKHGWFFLISLALFPRMTLLVSGLLFHSIEFGGIFWWLGFFFAPRILVAVLGTVAYWQTNPILVIFSWLIAIGGESSEKIIVKKRMSNAPHRFTDYQGGTTIDAEFKVKE